MPMLISIKSRVALRDLFAWSVFQGSCDVVIGDVSAVIQLLSYTPLTERHLCPYVGHC